LDVTIPFGKKTLIMGIINVSPDSFYAGSRILDKEKAITQALLFEELGADIVDIGGESTRPGSQKIDVEEEMTRVLPVIEGIRKRSNILVSIDTYKYEVAARALKLGVHIVNDITGLGTADQTSSASYKMGKLIAGEGVYVILMHMRGIPRDMQSRAQYRDVTAEVSKELDVAIHTAQKAGIDPSKIILDPGIGFSKTAEHNLCILKNLPLIKRKGYPILVGLSRKSFIGIYTGLDPQERLIPTVAANAISIFQGADIIRVHDVREAVDTVRMVDAIMSA
jgi:dihydropteroate synthase